MEEEIRQPIGRVSKEKSFQCLCSRKYGTITSLRNHINIKHYQEKEKYDARVTKFEAEIKAEKKKLAANNKVDLTLKQVDANQEDLIKFAIVDRTHLRIASVFKGEGLLDTAEEDEIDCFEDDVDAEMNTRDFNLIGEVHELIEFYRLEGLFEKGHEFPELALRPKSGHNGKNICMKKELTQLYCSEWAAKMDLQLELFALQVWQHLSGDEILRVESCSKEMWGEDYQMIQILKLPQGGLIVTKLIATNCLEQGISTLNNTAKPARPFKIQKVTTRLSQTKLQQQILRCSNGHELNKGDSQ